MREIGREMGKIEKLRKIEKLKNWEKWEKLDEGHYWGIKLGFQNKKTLYSRR